MTREESEEVAVMSGGGSREGREVVVLVVVEGIGGSGRGEGTGGAVVGKEPQGERASGTEGNSRTKKID